MSRPPRAFVPGYPVHIIHRGNDRQPIFRVESDFRYLWRCLRETAEECGVAVNAYVFMTNHVHLLLTPERAESISKALHSVSRRYAGYFNVRYGRTGTLWEGRFRASLVTNDSYFIACHRYIDLNPVRAGLVRVPADYAWSSHRFYALGEANSLVTAHKAIAGLGEDADQQRRAYSALFKINLEAGMLDQIRLSARAGCPVGEAKARTRNCP